MSRRGLHRPDRGHDPRAGRHAPQLHEAFYDGTVNFAGRVTGYAYDGYTMTTTIYDQTGGVVGVTNSLGETIIVGPEHGVLSTITDPSATQRP